MMTGLLLPDLAQKLAAETFFAGGAIGHQPFRGRQDRDAQAGANLWDRAVTYVHALAGTRAPAQTGDRVGARVRPAEAHDDLRKVVVVLAHVVAGDVALVLEHDGEPLLQLGHRRNHLRLAS